MSTAAELAMRAVITAGGQIIGANWDTFFGAREHSDVDENTTASVRETLVVSGQVDWVRYRDNVTYRTTTDGILSAFSGGDGAVTGALCLKSKRRIDPLTLSRLPLRQNGRGFTQRVGGTCRVVGAAWCLASA